MYGILPYDARLVSACFSKMARQAPARTHRAQGRRQPAVPEREGKHLSVQGKGVGGVLLVEAMPRARQMATDNGDVLRFVDAKDGQASFHAKYGFTALLTDQQTLFIPTSEIP